MAAQDKTIKITIVVDSAAADKAKRAIIEIKDAVDALVEAAKKAGQGLGNLGMNVSSTPGQTGTSPSTQTQHGGGQGGAGGLQVAMTMGAQASGASVKKFAGEYKDYAKSITDTTSKLAAAQAAEVTRMKGVWSSFKETLKGMDFKGGFASFMGGAQTGTNKDGSARRSGNGFIGTNQAIGQTLGIPGWAMGTQGAVGFAAGAVGTMYSAYGANRAAENRYALEQPLMNSRVSAQFGATMGANAVAVRHGDLARSWAIDQVKKTDAYKDIISSDYKKRIQEKVILETPTNMKEAVASGKIGKVWDQFTSDVGAGASVVMKHPGKAAKELGASALGAVGGFFGVSRKNLGLKENYLGDVNDVVKEADVRRQEALVAAAPMQAKARQELIENQIKSNPMFASQLNEFYGGAMGQQSLARMAGIGGGFYTRKDGTRADSVADFESRSMGRLGISGGEHAGLMQQMGATAGRGFFYQGGSLLSPQAGGLSNAGQIFGVGAQFGAGGDWKSATGFMKGVQGSIGRGGLDVTAGVQTAGLGMAALTSGRFQANGGGGMMQTLMEASAGGSTGADMRGAREAAMGFHSMDKNIMGGGLDPLQKALQYSTAMEVAGNLPWQTQKALANMDAATMMEVLRNPNSAEANALKSKGVTAELMRKMFTGSQSRTFTRVVADQLTDRGKTALASFQAGGGNTNYMRGMVAKVNAARAIKDPKKRAKAMAAAQGELDASISDLSAVFEMDRGATTGEARGIVTNMMAMEGNAPKLAGKGAHRADSMKTTRAQAIKKQAEAIRKTGEEEGKSEEAIQAAIANMEKNVDAEGKAHAAAVAAGEGGDLNATIDQLDGILRKFVGQLHQSAGGKAAPPG